MKEKIIILQDNRKSHISILKEEPLNLPVEAVADPPEDDEFVHLTSYYSQKLYDAKEADYHCIGFYGKLVPEDKISIEDTAAISILSIRNWFSENPEYEMNVCIGCESEAVFHSYHNYMEMLKKRESESIDLTQADHLLKEGSWKKALDLYNKAYYQAKDKQDFHTFPEICLQIVRLFGEKLSEEQLKPLLSDAEKYYTIRKQNGEDVSRYLYEIEQLKDWYF